jgi:low affinity Fe/Cu permease
LIVFLIQNAQNRDAKALHLKLDELIHSIRGARNQLIDLENCTETELTELETEFSHLANQPAKGQPRSRKNGATPKR